MTARILRKTASHLAQVSAKVWVPKGNMAFHLSIKLGAVSVVLISVLTVLNTPLLEVMVSLAITPSVKVLAEPRAKPDTGVRYTFHGPDPTPTLTLRATGYNSEVSQTDTTPFVTATGASTRWGIIAVSRDLLDQSIPYGSLVRIRDLGSYDHGRGYGAFQRMLDGQEFFIVEDTTHRRKRQQIDVWFSEYNQAINWGVRKVEVEVVRYGRDGPVLDYAAQPQVFTVVPRLQASR
jgi:3D (Asp-Asp-Asp) domain-containing protein